MLHILSPLFIFTLYCKQEKTHFYQISCSNLESTIAEYVHLGAEIIAEDEQE